MHIVPRWTLSSSLAIFSAMKDKVSAAPLLSAGATGHSACPYPTEDELGYHKEVATQRGRECQVPVSKSPVSI
jgi:hypothetical protein